MKEADVHDSRKPRVPPTASDRMDPSIPPATRREPHSRLTAAAPPPLADLPLTDHNLSSSPGGRTLASNSSSSSSPPCGAAGGGLSSPHSSLPDQNSNSVRDLEAAMSKHLPKDEEDQQQQLHPFHHHHQPSDSGGGLEAAAAAATTSSLLLKQFYSRQAAASSYLAELGEPAVAAESQFLPYAAARLGYAAAAAAASSPAQPLPLKPPPPPSNIYGTAIGLEGAVMAASAYGSGEYSHHAHHPQPHLYPHSSFHLYNRGQTWYTGN